MIIIKNRELMIPGNERFIGTPLDNETDIRQFRMDRFSQSGFDLSNLAYRLDLRYPETRKVYTFSATTSRTGRSVTVLTRLYAAAYPNAGTITFTYNGSHWNDGSQNVDLEDIGVCIAFTPNTSDTITVVTTIANVDTDTVLLTKEIHDDYFVLTWEITSSQTVVPGTVFVNLRGFNEDAEQRYASFPGVFYVEKNINSPDTYPGNLSELEQLEAAIADALKHAEELNAVSEDIVDDANAFALLSEAHARGTRNNVPVSSGQIGYHDNSKYWSEISHTYANQVSYKKIYTNVAEMIADTELINGQTVRTLGYYAVNDGGGALYRIYSTAPSTHYETLANGLYAELINTDQVTPQVFGAHMDGVTDDASAINAAAQYAISINKPLYLLKGVYYSSADVNFRYVKRVICDGEISLASGKYVIIGDASAFPADADYYINRATRVKVVGLMDSHVFIGYAAELLVYVKGDDATGYAVGYNIIEGLFIPTVTLYSDTGAASENTGWINENTFDIRRIQTLSIGGNYPHSNNRFLNCCIEGADASISIDNGHDNYISYRGEGLPLSNITLGSDTYNNSLVQTWTGTLTAPYFYQSTDANNTTLKALNARNFVGVERLEYTNRGHAVAIDINHKCFNGMSGYLTANGRLYGYSGQTLFSSKPIRLPSGSPVQIVLCGSDKRFKFPNVHFYDASMQLVTLTKNNVSGAFKNADYGTTTGNITAGVYEFASIYVIDTDTIKYISFDVAIASGYGGEFDYFYADFLTSKALPTNIVPATVYAKNVHTNYPDRGVWEVGEIVYNKSPSSGSYVGWVCTVAGTPGTWAGFGQIA